MGLRPQWPPVGPHCPVPSKPLRSMDRFEGQKARLNPSASLITVPITALTLPISLFYFISNASLSCFPLLSIFPFYFILLDCSLTINLSLFVSCTICLPTYPFLTLFFFHPFSLSLCLSPSSFYLPVSHYIPYLSLSLLLPPPTLFLSPIGLRLPVVDYHTSKKLSSLSPVGPISCPIERQSIYWSLCGQNHPRNSICRNMFLRG